MEGILVVMLSIVLVFALLLVLLLELCCSIHCRRQLPPTPLPTTAANVYSSSHSKAVCNVDKHQEAAGDQTPVCPEAAAFYAHGVLQPASTDFLLAIPAVKEEEITREVRGKNSVHHFGLLSPAASVASVEGGASPVAASRHGVCGGGTEHFVYISNPMYDGNSREWVVGEDCGGGDCGGDGTPFETPDTSPSRMEEPDKDEDYGDYSPPLTLMKKLPVFRPMGFSSTAWLVDGRPSIAASTSVTDTNRPSSSSSNSLCSSPSW